MTNRTRSLAVVLTAIGIAAAALALPAGAFEEETIAVPARATVEKDYPPIAAPDPATVTVDHTLMGPDECRRTPSCALVPIDVEAPTDLEPADDFYVILTMSWTQEGADLDTFLYDDKQTRQENGDGSGYTEIGSSASGDNPEQIKAFEPLYGRYNLVVINFAGAAVDWHLKAESIVGEFVPPSESLAPAPGSGTSNPRDKPTSTTAAPTTTTTVATTTTVSIPEGVVLPDDDFEGGEFDFDAVTAQVDELQAAAAALEANREPQSPSALTVVLWMVVLPGAILGGGVAVLLRRRRGRGSRPAPATASS